MSGKKYRIGYTTGVFDLFHIGHLNLLQRAKEQCEVLVVGVSTDDVVEAYKHKMPLVPYEERKRIVEGLRCVDLVIPQTTMDKREAWNVLRYDVLFHGDEWKNTKMYRQIEEELREVGADVVYLPHTEGISSTRRRGSILGEEGLETKIETTNKVVNPKERHNITQLKHPKAEVSDVRGGNHRNEQAA